jgi:hypothetical protein
MSLSQTFRREAAAIVGAYKTGEQDLTQARFDLDTLVERLQSGLADLEDTGISPDEGDPCDTMFYTYASLLKMAESKGDLDHEDVEANLLAFAEGVCRDAAHAQEMLNDYFALSL